MNEWIFEQGLTSYILLTRELCFFQVGGWVGPGGGGGLVVTYKLVM
jgi:hypothetical protein